MTRITKSEGVAVGAALVATFGILFFGNLLFNQRQAVKPSAGAVQAASVAGSNEVIGTLSGLVSEDTVIGAGDPVKVGDAVSVNYVGSFTDGRQFDSSYARGAPLTFVVGNGELIKGFDEGVIGMKVGGKRRLTIPPELGYGSEDAGGIPGNSTLIFDVELMKIGK